MEKETRMVFVVEIESARLFFNSIEEASDIFAKLSGSSAVLIRSVNYSDKYCYVDGKPDLALKARNIELFKTKKGAEFEKENNEPEKED